MPRYRLYFQDDGGQIADVLDLPVESDEEALELVSSLDRGTPMELWDRSRLIKAYLGKTAAKPTEPEAGSPER